MKCTLLKLTGLATIVIALSSCDNPISIEPHTELEKTGDAVINDVGTGNAKPEGDSEKPAGNKSGPHPGGDIIILKNINASYAEVFINLLQLGSKKKIISENISPNSDCRSFGFPVLYYTSLMTPSSDADVYYFRKEDPESDDSTCQLIDYSVSADNKKGGVGFMLYSIEREKYDQPDNEK